LDTYPVTAQCVGQLFKTDGKYLERAYKEHLSDFGSWDQKGHAEDWVLFVENMGVHMTVAQIQQGMKEHSCDISQYYVRQILEFLGFRNRSFIKDLPLKDVKERDAQFCHIADVRAMCQQLGLPILSIDTKKKNL